MAASITDKITRVTNGSRPVPTTLVADLPAGASPGTANCGALTGWSDVTAMHFILYNIDTNNKKIPGTQTDWKGIVVGNNITNLELQAGSNTGYGVGTVVEAAPTGAWADELAEALLTSLNPDGTFKTNVPITTNAAILTSAKILTALLDTNGNELLDVTAIASAVNQMVLANAATGGRPKLSAAGGDTDINVEITGKGAGGVLIKNPYKFSAYKTTNQSASNDQKILFDTENFDTGSNYDSATNSRFTAPVAGYYQFHTQLYVSSATTSTQVMFKKNGSTIAYGDAQSSTNSSDVIVSGNLFIQLAANDYIEVFIFLGGGATRTIQGTAGVANIPTRFEGYLVSL